MAKANAKKAGKKVSCTCGCKLDVAPSTKQNHLKGKGTTALRARVFAETESLTMVDGPQHERQNNRNRGSKRWLASNPDEGSVCKRLKASQLESSVEPNISIFQADINPMDQLVASTEPESSPTVQAGPLPAVSTQSNDIVERTRHAIEQRWGSRHDNLCDEDEDNGNKDDEDKNKDSNEDEDENSNEDENDEGYEDENERPSLSTWDLLGEAFEREAAALGSS